jgi:hypothetical protein
MPDGYMNPNELGREQDTTDKAETPKATREQPKIQFPYMDLEAAVEVARVMRDRGGNSTFTRDQLAAMLGHGVTSGTFAAKMHAARMFGLVEGSAGRFKVSQLGFDVVDPDPIRAGSARMEAFLRVPLYKRTYEEYRGKTLPSRPHGLERVFLEFGVAPKRGGNARLAFERSARQAGFYEHGDDRLVAPLITGSPEQTERIERVERAPDLESETASVEIPPSARRHKLIEGLLQELPEPHAKWTAAEQARWLRLAASMFDVLYISDDKIVVIDVKTAPAGAKRAKIEQTDRS